MTPGATPTTRTPAPAHSTARLRTRFSTPALAAPGQGNTHNGYTGGGHRSSNGHWQEREQRDVMPHAHHTLDTGHTKHSAPGHLRRGAQPLGGHPRPRQLEGREVLAVVGGGGGGVDAGAGRHGVHADPGLGPLHGQRLGQVIHTRPGRAWGRTTENIESQKYFWTQQKKTFQDQKPLLLLSKLF